MNWLALIPKRLLLELAGGLLSAIGLWALWQYGQHWHAQYDTEHTALHALQQAEIEHAKQHKLALQSAEAGYQAELAAIRSHAAAGSGIGTIVLRPCAAPRVPARSAAADGDSTAAPVGVDVPAADTGSRTDGGDRKSPMLTAFAAVLDAQVAALRAEQAVH